MSEIARIASVLGTTVDDLVIVDDVVHTRGSLSFMGSVADEGTLQKINQIRLAIDEIHMLEELLYA